MVQDRSFSNGEELRMAQEREYFDGEEYILKCVGSNDRFGLRLRGSFTLSRAKVKFWSHR